jgi:hypothetical protein
MESADSATAFGFVLAYQYPTEALKPDYVAFYYQTDGSTNSVVQENLEAGKLKGKMRNTFGPYLVWNEDWKTLKVMGF